MFSISKIRGFTLIELMIVVAIIAILATIGFPMYQDYVRKVRRVDATSVLTEASQYMERFYTANHRYHQDLAGTAVAIPGDLVESPKQSSVKFYDITLPNATLSASGYTLVATPKGGQAGNGILIITNTGARGWDNDNNGTVDADETCWNKKCS
jgi:type IV pilus assembly protein PilE